MPTTSPLPSSLRQAISLPSAGVSIELSLDVPNSESKSFELGVEGESSVAKKIRQGFTTGNVEVYLTEQSANDPLTSEQKKVLARWCVTAA